MGVPGQGSAAGRAVVLRIEPRCASLAPSGLPSLTPTARLLDPGLRASLAWGLRQLRPVARPAVFPRSSPCRCRTGRLTMTQDDTAGSPTPDVAPKIAPESVALRAQPRPVTRLNR